MVYYFLAILFFVFGLNEVGGNRKVNSSYIFCITVILIVAGLKIKGSTDYSSYKSFYEYVDGSFSFYSFYEPGFQLFSLIIKGFGAGFVMYYFLFTCVSIGTKALIFRKLCPYLFPALLIYLCGLFFERDNDGIRQGMSIAFCFLSLYFLFENKKMGFIISIIIAISFHYTSAVFLLSYFLDKVKVKNRTIAIVVAIFTGLCIMHLSLSSIFINYIPLEVTVIKLQQYSNSEASATMGLSIGLLFRIGILLTFMHLRNKMKIEDRHYIILRNGFAISILMSLAFNDFILIAHRLPYAFRELQIIIVPYLFTAIKQRNNRIAALFIVFIYSILLLWRFLNGDASVIYGSYENYLFS